jgi:hypothetical protein
VSWLVNLERIAEFRAQANKPVEHRFREGVIGGHCQLCGSSGAKPHPCRLPSDVRVERETFLELLALAEQQLAPSEIEPG